MAGYDCKKVEYIEGTTKACADLLSRHPDNVRLEKMKELLMSVTMHIR